MNQNEKSFQECLQQIESLARQGRRPEILRIFKSLNLRQIPRALKSAFAEVAWRNHAPIVSLRILSPVIRSDRVLDSEVTPQEKIVYATSLINVGVTREASEILSSIDSSKYPEVLLRKSFALFGEWNYRDSLPLLRKYCHSTQISEYQKVVGQVNLIAAQIACNESLGLDDLAEQVRWSTEKNNSLLLQGNLFELLAQHQIFLGNLSEASRHLENAEKILIETKGLYYLFVRKWKAVIHALENSGHPDGCQQLEDIRAEAISSKHWEVVRDCDLFMAVSKSDVSLFEKVMWGTPFQDYKKRALMFWGKSFEFEKKYLLQSSQIEKLPPEKVFDSEEIQLPKNLRILMGAMTEDFYKPIWIGSLFKKVYPNEYFDPYTSEQRIKNLIVRQRAWFREQGFEMNLISSNQAIQLEIVSSSRQAVMVYKRRRSRHCQILQQFFEKTKKSIFCARDLAVLFGKSKRWSHQIIQLGVSSGQIHTLRNGRATLYRFGAYGRAL